MRVFQVVLWDPRVETKVSGKWRRRRENALRKAGAFSIPAKFQFPKKRERDKRRKENDFGFETDYQAKLNESWNPPIWEWYVELAAKQKLKARHMAARWHKTKAKLEGHKMTKNPIKWTKKQSKVIKKIARYKKNR